MKLSTIAATLFLFSQAHASPDVNTSTRRMRSVKLYSSSSQKGADTYTGIFGESQQRQRVLKHNSKPKPDTTESSPTPTLEMSMPTEASMPNQQSFSYSQQDSISTSTAFDVVDPYIGLPDERKQRDLKHNSKPKPGRYPTPMPILEMSMPTGTSMPNQQSFSYPQHDAVSASTASDVVDPYIGLPDERKQRDLKHNSKQKPGRYPTPVPTLEMSMPTGTSMSLSYPLKQESTSTVESDNNMIRRRELGRGKGKGKRPKPTCAPTLEMSMPTGASMSMSLSYSDQDSASQDVNVDFSRVLHRRTAEESVYNAAKVTKHSLVVVVAAIVSLIAGVVVWA